MTSSFPDLLVLYPVFSYARQVFRGDIVRRYPAQSIPLILIVMHYCSPRAIPGRPYHSAVLPNFYSIIIPVHTYTVRILYLPNHYCIQFLSYRTGVLLTIIALFSFEVFDAESGGTTPGERASKKLASPSSRIWISRAKFCFRKCLPQLNTTLKKKGEFPIVLPASSLVWHEASPIRVLYVKKGSWAVQTKTSCHLTQVPQARGTPSDTVGILYFPVDVQRTAVD